MNARTLITSLLVLLVIAAAAYHRFKPTGPAQVPDISLMSVDGAELQLPDYRGRPLLITFWSTTCPACIREIPHLAELYRELAPRGLEIIGISTEHDPPNQVLEMRKSRGMPYPVTLDIHADAARAFGNVRVTPTTFLIAPDGRVAQRKVGSLDMTGLRQEILAMIAQQAGAAAESAGPGP